VQRSFARHWVLRDLLLLLVLVVLLYGGFYFNLAQFWIFDLEVSLIGYPP
jgi:hypothetical protein